ncbi:hypothetical protein N9L76_08225 [bacterium]|nr:hypothetical protein [bacterium]
MAITRTDRRDRGTPRCCRERGVADAVGTVDLKLVDTRAMDDAWWRRMVARET